MLPVALARVRGGAEGARSARVGLVREPARPGRRLAGPVPRARSQLADATDLADVILLVFGDPIEGADELARELAARVASRASARPSSAAAPSSRSSGATMQRAGVPVFPSPERAMRAIGASCWYAERRRQLGGAGMSAVAAGPEAHAARAAMPPRCSRRAASPTSTTAWRPTADEAAAVADAHRLSRRAQGGLAGRRAQDRGRRRRSSASPTRLPFAKGSRSCGGRGPAGACPAPASTACSSAGTSMPAAS